MTQAVPLEERVTKLEREMREVRYMAGRTDREVSDLQVTLKGHNGVLNAIREDQVDQGKKLDLVERRLGKLEMKVDENFAKVDENFAKVDENFAKVEAKFDVLYQGQEKITQLLNRHLGEPDDDIHGGGGGE
ncbi:hypothetical protein [Actinophytocola oryzae]|uniref:Uncharacterized protein n=1 Tax=Actinophytocola oryzae TaxID=502181 RepID=A0A4R7VSN2_9PSEU|nr:hypothetical protein [Actinophytocola oryzae]TDV52379.1 hypothetical protein CLV71_105511 [Actinophytocola oryzae]